MTTTIMRDSTVGDQWIMNTIAAVPIQRTLNDKGEPTQDILTGPVRLAWVDSLFELPAPTAQNANPKHGCTLIFPPTNLINPQPFYDDYYKVCASDFADHYDAGTGQYFGLHSPFPEQTNKLKFQGYTPGGFFMNVSTKFKPSIIDARGNPIIDKAKVYPGVWAIASINAYPNKDNRTKGVRFGLQNLMIIGDDKPLGGGGADPQQTFKGVQGKIAAPIVRPDAAAMMGRQPSPNAAPSSGVPQGAPGGVPTPSYPQPSAPPPSTPVMSEEDELRELMGY